MAKGSVCNCQRGEARMCFGITRNMVKFLDLIESVRRIQFSEIDRHRWHRYVAMPKLQHQWQCFNRNPSSEPFEFRPESP